MLRAKAACQKSMRGHQEPTGLRQPRGSMARLARSCASDTVPETGCQTKPRSTDSMLGRLSCSELNPSQGQDYP